MERGAACVCVVVVVVVVRGAGSEQMAKLTVSLLVVVALAALAVPVVPRGAAGRAASRPAVPRGAAAAGAYEPAGRGRILGRLLAAHAPAAAGDVSPGAPTDAALASVSRKFRGQKPPMRPHRMLGLHEPTRQPATAGAARTGCPEPLAGTVNATGRLPVDYFRDTLNVTCDQAVRLAMNMSRDHCGGVVYFVSPCGFASTVEVIGGMGFAGGPNGQDEFSTQPQTVISGPASGPAFSVQHVDQVHFSDLAIIGAYTGVYITDAALIHFTNVAIHATTQGTGADNVNLTAAGCDGCNVVLGSNNTALVIENSFWIWAEDCSFYFYPLYASGPPAYNIVGGAENDFGQRPSVIIRGNRPSLAQ